MQYNVQLAITDAEDLFEVLEILKPISDSDKVKIVAAMPRGPLPVTQQPNKPAVVRPTTPTTG